VLLKITGDGKDIRVSYDMKAAGNRIREDIKKERQTLRQIFSEEYGSGGSRTDGNAASTADQEQTARPRFRITWEGNDTASEEPLPETVPEDRENLFETFSGKKDDLNSQKRQPSE
jgi:hypothetical protein